MTDKPPRVEISADQALSNLAAMRMRTGATKLLVVTLAAIGDVATGAVPSVELGQRECAAIINGYSELQRAVKSLRANLGNMEQARNSALASAGSSELKLHDLRGEVEQWITHGRDLLAKFGARR